MPTSNYREMTGHAKVPKTKALKASIKSTIPQMPTVPVIGQVLDISPIMIFQDEGEDGKLGTPMSKIRWFPEQKEWRQVGRNAAGMFVFFLNEPEANHTKCVIRSIIPTKTACYAELLA